MQTIKIKRKEVNGFVINSLNIFRLTYKSLTKLWHAFFVKALSPKMVYSTTLSPKNITATIPNNNLQNTTSSEQPQSTATKELVNQTNKTITTTTATTTSFSTTNVTTEHTSSIYVESTFTSMLIKLLTAIPAVLLFIIFTVFIAIRNQQELKYNFIICFNFIP